MGIGNIKPRISSGLFLLYRKKNWVIIIIFKKNNYATPLPVDRLFVLSPYIPVPGCALG
jgi:hypothetical protein